VDETADRPEHGVDPAALRGQPVQSLGDQVAEGGGGVPGEILPALLVDHAEPHEDGQLAVEQLR
jgi:hypothetical protein